MSFFKGEDNKRRKIEEIESHFGGAPITTILADIPRERILLLPETVIGAIMDVITSNSIQSLDLFQSCVRKQLRERRGAYELTPRDVFEIHCKLTKGRTGPDIIPDYIMLTPSHHSVPSPRVAPLQETYTPPRHQTVSTSNALSNSAPHSIAACTPEPSYAHTVSNAPHPVSPLTPAPMRSEPANFTDDEMRLLQSPPPTAVHSGSGCSAAEGTVGTNTSTASTATATVSAPPKRPRTSPSPHPPQHRRKKRERHSTGGTALPSVPDDLELSRMFVQRMDHARAAEQELAAMRMRVQDLEGRVAGFKQAVKTLEDEKGGLKGEVETLRGDKGGLQQEVDRLREENGGLERRSGGLEQEVEGLKVGNAVLEDEKVFLEGAKAGADDLNKTLAAEIAALLREKAIMEQDVAKAKREGEKAKGLEEYAEKLADAKREVDMEVEALRSEKERLERGKEDVEEKYQRYRRFVANVPVSFDREMEMEKDGRGGV